MTPEQVSALSDDQLNKAMIWLFCRCKNMSIWAINMNTSLLYFDYEEEYDYDYLTDYNLTMPLVIENGLNIEECNGGWLAYCAYSGMQSNAWSEDYLRAACECLVLIAMSKANG